MAGAATGSAMRAAALGLALALAACAPPDRLAALRRACQGPADHPLADLHRSLCIAEGGGGPALILQIGDSHTANDSFSGRMRELFRDRFGDAGRGMLPPGIPHRWYRPEGVAVAADGWTAVSAYRGAEGPFGIAAIRQRADRAARMEAMVADLSGEAEVEVLAQPGGGTVEVRRGGGPPVSLSTRSAETRAVWVAAPPSPGARTLAVEARGDGPVDVLAWRVGTGRSGTSYSNLGTIGATMALADRWDPAIARAELARLAPAAIVLAFGTNEGFDDSLDLDAYAAMAAARMRTLRAAAPEASLVVLGPPDAERARRAAPARKGAHAPVVRAVPPNLDRVRAALRRAAADNGAFFWDWQAAMGGPGSAARWAAASPPAVAPDHVHMLAPGYRRTAEALFGALMEGYGRRRAGAPGV